MVSLSSPKTQRFQNLRPIRILIIDDLRAKLQDVLNKLDNLDLVATAEDGDRAIALIEILKPDVVLMDVEMPHLNGIEVIKIITQRFPEAKILALSSHEKEEYIWQIISAGAEGYILKHSPLKDLFAAIDVVYRGYSHFDAKILKKLQLVISQEPSTLNKNNLKAKLASNL